MFAIDGHQERLGENIFLFTPNVVQITAQGSAQPTFNPTVPVEQTQPSMLHTMSAIAPPLLPPKVTIGGSGTKMSFDPDALSVNKWG